MTRQTTKVVRFYDPVLASQDGTKKRFKDGFWPHLETILSSKDVADRTVRFNGADYFGFCRTEKSPAARFVKVGRQRTRSDQPDTVNTTSGSETPLVLPDDQKLFEPTFLLPFGAKNRVAIMGQTFSAPRIGAVERWLTCVLGYLESDKSVELQPVVDKALAKKLADSIGVTTLEVAFPRGSEGFQLHSTKLGTVGSALVEAARSTDESGAGVRWSFGHSTPNPGKMKELLQAARALFKQDDVLDTLKVGLMLPVADGSSRVEHIDLLEEKITAHATYAVAEDEQVPDSSVLFGMNGAIQEFNTRVG